MRVSEMKNVVWGPHKNPFKLETYTPIAFSLKRKEDSYATDRTSTKGRTEGTHGVYAY